MKDQQTASAPNRRERRRIAKIGAERAAADNARPEWVRVNVPGETPRSVACVTHVNICVNG